jgi:hypothetical protein
MAVPGISAVERRRKVADHLITGTITYVVVHCGNGRCKHVWEQAHTALDDPGTNVCPKCLCAAPTNIAGEEHAA